MGRFAGVRGAAGVCVALMWCGLSSGGCAGDAAAAAGGRRPGPGAFVASVGGGIVNVHDGLARALLGEAAEPMLIAAPRERSGRDDASDRATPAAAKLRPSRTPLMMASVSELDAAVATSADLDGDGGVSVDEVVALARCGITDVEVLERLERTGRTFDLSASQEEYLRVRGVADDVIARLRRLNRGPAPAAPSLPPPTGNVVVMPTSADAPAPYDSDAAAR